MVGQSIISLQTQTVCALPATGLSSTYPSRSARHTRSCLANVRMIPRLGAVDAYSQGPTGSGLAKESFLDRRPVDGASCSDKLRAVCYCMLLPYSSGVLSLPSSHSIQSPLTVPETLLPSGRSFRGGSISTTLGSLNPSELRKVS